MAVGASRIRELLTMRISATQPTEIATVTYIGARNKEGH